MNATLQSPVVESAVPASEAVIPAASAYTGVSRIQCKLAIGAVDDPMEHEAETMADRVMRMPDPVAVQRKCAHCEEEEQVQRKPLAAFIQRMENSTAGVTGDAVSGRIDATRGSGNSMDMPTMSFMESRFGADFSGVRVHTGADAVQLSAELNAQAFTVGNDIYFNEGKYNPGSAAGRHLLAHELTHTIQQGGSGINRKMIQRFEASERPNISNLAGIMAEARSFADNALSVEGFVEQAGGSSMVTVLGTADSVMENGMHNRYLVTCRCGMIDMRHFYQLMYIASKFTNRRATAMGRDHELEAEATSRFAAEDTTSNALGAFFGANSFDLFYTSTDTLMQRLNTFLSRCSPVDFSALPAPEQNNIVNFYAQRDGAGVPANQSEVATPAVLSISACNGRHRSFPFTVDPDEQRTITGEAYTHGTTGLDNDDDIRDFVRMQRPEIIQSIDTAEKVRLVGILLSYWVTDADLDAVQAIVQNAGTAQVEAIRASVNPTSLTSVSQRTRLRLLLNM